MRITSNAYPYQTPAQKTGATSGASRRASFGEQLNVAAVRSTDNIDKVEITTSAAEIWQTEGTMKPSPYIALMNRYDVWKEKQPPQDLPDSWGPTEENRAYLKEHYSGDLSWEERVDALETMEQLGVITHDQKYDALGSQTRTLNINDWDYTVKVITEDMKKAMEEYSAYLNGGWDACFQDRIISTFKTSDDLFAWLDKILEDEI